jgi:beta-N-acetylhexosaminidase
MESGGTRAAIVGIAGTTLSDAEHALFAAYPPAGVILFARNIGTPARLARLTAAVRAALPPEGVLMVDQEGGRVARLRPPHWRAHPAAALIGALHRRDGARGLRAAWLTGALIGLDCRGAGFDVVNAPVLDLRVEGAHGVIGDRAFSDDPQAVAALGGAMAAGLRAAGVQPVAKHIPGHGRATADSHLELPRLAHGAKADLIPFIANAGIGWAMTAHIVYAAWDPMRPATLSQAVIREAIRGACGFGGVLVSDDLDMRALTGAPGDLARQAIAAGCDLVLHCTGEIMETEAVLAECPLLSEQAAARMQAARAAARAETLDGVALAAERDALLVEDAG